MRVLFNNVEISKEVERLDTSSFSMTYVVGDFIHIASDFPFNHIFIKPGTIKNVINASMKVEYYGSGWNEAVELRDETNGLKTEGFIEFTPNENKGWTMEDASTAGLTKVIYEKYWMRISFNVDLTAAIDLSFMGHKFSDDTDLFMEYPIFNDSNFLSAFKSGKTTWEEQAVKAADLICMDLMKKSVIIGPEQILDRKKFIGASVCKTAEIIFTAFGNDYLEQKKTSREDYYHRLDLSQYAIDTNGDGILSPIELRTKQGWLSR